LQFNPTALDQGTQLAFSGRKFQSFTFLEHPMNFTHKFLVKPGSNLNLSKIAHTDHALSKHKETNAQLMQDTGEQLNVLQWKLYSENRRSLLLVFQAMDAGGKDGVIRHVLQPMSPQGVRVESFKGPSSLELSHDFLWRIHSRAPRHGEICVFNRSHYEDVLVARVHKLVPKPIWKERYKHINEFERLLTEQNHTRILKFYLHMSAEEQLKRFEERLNNPHKNWKISDADYKEREFWDQYMEAFEEALERTSTEHAPWFIVPSDDKLSRNLIVAEIIREALEDMNPKYPEITADLNQVRARYFAAKQEEKQLEKKDKKRKSK
jgi:PPK2 family polyphosphate:nucleotide phosphotransferase